MEHAGLDKETLEAALGSLGEFAARHLPDAQALQLDADDEFPEEIVRRMCSDELGVQLFFVPSRIRRHGRGLLRRVPHLRADGRVDVGVATGRPRDLPRQRADRRRRHPGAEGAWLGRIASEGLLFAYGATEPQAGSDLASLRTVAEPVVEDGELTGYRITGNKQWISNGGVADAYCVLANAPGGPTWFVVEKGEQGMSPGKPEDKHGIRASNTAACHVRGRLRADRDRLVGGSRGRASLQAQAVFGYTRLMVAAFGLGAGWAALDRAIEYSTTRIQAGGPLSEKQGTPTSSSCPTPSGWRPRGPTSRCGVRLDAAEERLNTEGAIAKLPRHRGRERGRGRGDPGARRLRLHKEYMVEKIKRDVRITTIYEGTSEIMEMTVSRDRWQLHLKTRGAALPRRGEEAGGPRAAFTPLRSGHRGAGGCTRWPRCWSARGSRA
jgi:acyl-CoA dehydrogenase